jgi:Ca2+-binding EF-hand superfamily protein
MEGEFRMNDNLKLLRENVDTVDNIFEFLPQWLQDLVSGEGFGEYCDMKFAEVDSDGNGKLTPDELFPIIEEMVTEHPLSITYEHCIEFAKVFDDNMDGVISRSEFRRFFEFMVVYETLNHDEDLLQMVLEQKGIVEAQYRMADNLARLKSNVETIDKIFHLLPDWLQSMVNDASFAQTCAEMFDKVDADGNGTLSPEELFPIIADMVDEHPLDITKSHCVAFANVFDANKDGVISKDEFNVFVKFILCYETLEANPDLLEQVLAEQGQYEDERAEMEDDLDAMIDQFEGEKGIDEKLKMLRLAKFDVTEHYDKLPKWLNEMITGEGFQDTCIQLFKAIDEDGNGVLTPEELFPVISEMCASNGMPADEKYITFDHCIESAVRSRQEENLR